MTPDESSKEEPPVQVRLPEANELTLATVRKIMPYGAFCTLTEYNNIEAFLHVSEVASRWIKNIHEFLSDNQKLVVKVMRVDREKGQIDVSLKRVNEEEKKNKLESIKRASRSEKLLQLAITKAKSPMKVAELSAKLDEIYGEAYSAMESILDNDDKLEDVQIPAELKKEIIDIVQKSIKKARVSVAAELTLRCSGPNGLEHVKKALLSVLPAQGEKEKGKEEQDVLIHYLGAPHYKLEIFSSNYKDAKKMLDKTITKISSSTGKDCTFEYKLEE